MSFSVDIKNEVSRLDSTREELISELSAIVRNSAVIDRSIVITVENNSVARRIFKLFKNVYDITPVITVRKKYFNNGLSYILDVKGKNSQILDDLSIVSNGLYKNIPMEYKELIDCYFDTVIQKSETAAKKKNVPEYEKLYEAPREKLSFAGADEIERLSWNTTMRLCDTDEYRDALSEAPDTVAYVEPDLPASAVLYSEEAKPNHTTVSEPEAAEKAPGADTYGLSASDIAFISALLQSSESGRGGIDDEATVERINEAFSDGFGDVIIEDTGDGFAIIEDYLEEITEWLKNI